MIGIICLAILTVVVFLGLIFVISKDVMLEIRTIFVIASFGIIVLWVIVIVDCLNRVKPGEVGVVVDMIGSEKGVEEKELTVGYHFIPPWKTLYLFPIYEQNHQWINEDVFRFQTQEGLSVAAPIGITFHLMPNKIHELFYKYRRGMDEITHLFIRNYIRNEINREASRMRVEDLLGPKKEEFFKNILDRVRPSLEPLGFSITNLYLIGDFSVPETVTRALNLKIEATQRAQQRENELREAEAQAKKEIAQSEGFAKSAIIKARAEAEANLLVSKSVTSELIQWQAVQKWDGALPHAMSSGGMPFIMQLGDKK